MVRTLKFGIVALMLFALLVADGIWSTSPGLIGSIMREMVAVFRDPETQWMVFLCLGTYFAAFLFLRSRAFPTAGAPHGAPLPPQCLDPATRRSNFGARRVTRSRFWLAGLLLVAAVVYALNYSPSSEALTLLGGVVVGQGLALWASRGPSQRRSSRGDKAHSNVGNPMEPHRLGCYDLGVVAMLVVPLSLVSVWQPGTGRDFVYHDHARWSAPWDNPNLFGLLMAAGMILAVGQGVQRLEAGGWRLAKDRDWKCGARVYGLAVLCLVAAGLMGRGLLHSFSRGAWLAAFCGLTHLFWNLRRQSTHLTPTLSPRPPGGEGNLLPRVSRLPGNWLPILVILISVSVLCFWHFGRTEWHPAQRAFSAVNTADFSWRNRVAAWEGALQIAVEHPWLGAGWRQVESLYEHYYLRPKLNESAAIEMNDYLMLGATLGIPGLFCFAMYVWVALTGESEIGNRKSQIGEAGWLRVACRAGAVVLLVGFWFDGGLFKLATGATFWILLELGREGSPA